MRDDFGGYDYQTTLAFFRYTIKNPTDVRNNETRAAWFTRCHDITCNDFKAIIKAREPDWFYRGVGDTTKNFDVRQTRNKAQK